QDRSRRVALRAFPGACGAHRSLPAEGLAGADIALAEAADPVRAAFAGDFLPRRVSGLRRPFRAGRRRRRCRTARACQRLRNPHHVCRGMAHFVVQARGRQGPCAQGCRGQRRSGGRRMMRSGAISTFTLAVLAALSAAQPAHAEGTAADCDVPASLLESDSSLPKVATAIKDGRPLNVLVIGSRSSTLGSEPGNAYPARMQAALKDRLPQLTVNVSVEIQASKTAEEVGGSLVKLVEAKKPNLVVWQTGTVDAMRSIDPDE